MPFFHSRGTVRFGRKGRGEEEAATEDALLKQGRKGRIVTEGKGGRLLLGIKG